MSVKCTEVRWKREVVPLLQKQTWRLQTSELRTAVWLSLSLFVYVLFFSCTIKQFAHLDTNTTARWGLIWQQKGKVTQKLCYSAAEESRLKKWERNSYTCVSHTICCHLSPPFLWNCIIKWLHQMLPVSITSPMCVTYSSDSDTETTREGVNF